MLKIKDNIDLKVLEEKYGFEHSLGETYYYTLSNKKSNKAEGYIIVNPCCRNCEYREIIFNCYCEVEDEIDESYKIDIIFDLIKDGLVEKVEENEK